MSRFKELTPPEDNLSWLDHDSPHQPIKTDRKIAATVAQALKALREGNVRDVYGTLPDDPDLPDPENTSASSIQNTPTD